MIDVDRLRVFREVITRGSFTAAAQALNFTQPAVSHHMTKLEQEVGVCLLERSPRGLRLTGAGEALLRHAETVLACLEDAERELAAIARLEGGALRLTAFPIAAATIIPPAVAVFRRRWPAVALHLTDADPPVALPSLADGQIELAIAYRYPVLAPATDPGLAWDDLLVDCMAVAVPARQDGDTEEPGRAEEPIDLSTLADRDWVAPYDCVCRDAIVQACRGAGFTPRVVSETNDCMAMQGLVAAGVGVALIPRLAAAVAVRPGVALRPLSGHPLTRVTSIVWRAEGYRSPAAATMGEILHATVSGLNDLPLPLQATQPVEAGRAHSVPRRHQLTPAARRRNATTTT
jgi:DNA-binding transcriptional LysR family regulator